MKITGKLPSGKVLDRLRQSPNFKGNEFRNLSDTPMMAADASYWKMIKDYFGKQAHTVPARPLPVVKTNLLELRSDVPVLVWFGHSSYILKINGKVILVDPVFSGNAAPVSFMVKAFAGTNAYSAADMPAIDYLVLTHDHYDHLDYKTIRELKPKIKKIYCSLGVSSHLTYWGIDESSITELDWWQSGGDDEGIEFIAAPARHFSGRGFRRNRSLWSSFIVRTKVHNFYLGGDSGYDSHFRQIGEQYGPFDIAILEAGQYNRMWPLIHMLPEETVQAAVDLRAKLLLPVHWGKFDLSMHKWSEPVERVLEKAKELSMPVVTPSIGQPVFIGSNDPVSNRWWDL